MRKYTIWVVGVIVVALVALFVWKVAFRTEKSDEHLGIAGVPTDIVLDFYNAWLLNRKGEKNNSADMLNSEALSREMKERLSGFDFSADETELDPVLCQTMLPEGFRSLVISENEDLTQILVLSEDRKVPNQAVVTLTSQDGLWGITDIYCSPGEQGPEVGEFSFDKTGHLLKDSLPDSFDKAFWHLVFEENGTPGYTAALVLDSASICVDGGGAEGVCKPNDQFSEAMRVHVQGQMTETGVAVERVEFLQN